jgi:hypothetical protein
MKSFVEYAYELRQEIDLGIQYSLGKDGDTVSLWIESATIPTFKITREISLKVMFLCRCPETFLRVEFEKLSADFHDFMRKNLEGMR